MTVKRAGLALCLAAFAASAFAQDKPLTLGECVQLALKNGFDVQIATSDFAAAKEAIPIAKGIFDPQLSAEAGRSSTKYGQFIADPTLPNSLLDTHIDQTTATVGLSQLLPTGTGIGIIADQNRLAISPSSTAINPSYTSGVRLTLTQPLGKGFGTRATRLPIKQAEASVDVARRNYESRGLEIIEATEIAYYELAGTREQLKVLNASLDLARTLQREAEQRFKAGVAMRLDVLQAEVGESNARLAVLDGDRIVRDSEERLRSLIGTLKSDAPLGPTVLDPRTSGKAPDPAQSFELAKQNSPDLQAQHAAVTAAQLNLAAAEDDLKPNIDFHAEAGLAGTNRDTSSAFNEAFNGQGNDWQIVLRATYPLGRTTEHAERRRTNHLYNGEILRTQQLEQAIDLEVRSAVREVTTKRESVDIAAFAAERSQLQYTAEKESFRAGASTSRRVLEAQTDLERARLTHLQTRLDLFRAQAALRRLEGSGYDFYNVKLSEPIP